MGVFGKLCASLVEFRKVWESLREFGRVLEHFGAFGIIWKSYKESLISSGEFSGEFEKL